MYTYTHTHIIPHTIKLQLVCKHLTVPFLMGHSVEPFEDHFKHTRALGTEPPHKRYWNHALTQHAYNRTADVGRSIWGGVYGEE